MKIAFATLYDARDIRRGSGSAYYFSRELERQGHEVHFIGPLDIRIPFMTKLFRRLSKELGKKYRSFQDPFVGRAIGRSVETLLNGIDYDVLITNDYCVAGYTEIRHRIILFTDAIFPYNFKENIHPYFENLSWISVFFCQHVIKQGLRKAALCSFPSQTTLDEAKKYGVGQLEKDNVIPWGANLNDPGVEISNTRRFSRIIERGKLVLLFIGKDWRGKGGDIAIATVKELHRRGIDVMLNIVGSEPPTPVNGNFVKLYGLLDKSDIRDREKLHDLYVQSDIFLLPSIAEGYGIVYVEAAAYGLPSLGYRTLGVSTAVSDGESGILLDIGENEIVFADVVESWFQNPDTYDLLVTGARNHYENTANWETTVTRLISAVKSMNNLDSA